METFQGDGGTLKKIVKNVMVFPLEVHVPGKTLGEGSYDMNEFQQGTRQHVVTNKVVQNFNIPRLVHVDARFYKVNNSSQHVITNYQYFN